jgi:O-antigen ligase
VLAIGFLTFLAWERKVILAGMPALGILLLAHRSAYIAIALGAFVSALTKGRQIKSILLLGFVGTVLAGMVFVFSSLTTNQVAEHSMGRLSETFSSTGTTEGRLAAITTTLEALADHPFVGMGYVKQEQLRRKSHSGGHSSGHSFNLLHPHNFVMSSLSKDGLIGTLILLLLLTTLVFTAKRLATYPGYREIGALLVGSIIFFIIFATMNTTFGSAGYVLWILAGTTLWFINQANAQEELP